MRRSILCAIGALMGTVVAIPAHADQDESLYLNLGYSRLSIESGTVAVAGTNVSISEADIDAIVVRAGYDFSANVGIEFEYQTGLDSQTIEFGVDGETIRAKTSVEQLLGAFSRFRLPVAEEGSLHARLGYVSAEVELEDEAGRTVTATTINEEGDDDAVAFGVGGEFAIGENFGIRADWTRYNIDAGWNALSIAGVLRF